MISKIQSTLTNNQETKVEKEYEDCLPCKLTGGLTFTALGGYFLKEANTIHKVPSKAKTAVGLGVTGVVFISAGIYRMLM